jgi:hypothetical protein
MSHWPRPDWRNHQAHQLALEGLPLSQWRWQWIRRHAEYERDFRDLPAIGTQDVLLSADGRSMTAENLLRTRLKRAAGTREKYGLDWMLDPSVDIAPPAVMGRPTVEMHLPLDQTRLQAQHDDGYAIIAVDLTRTKADIITAFEQMVDKEKAVREIAEPKRQRREWITYARVLDAYEDLDARPDEEKAKCIAEQLSLDPCATNAVSDKDVRLWHKRALQEQEAAIAGRIKASVYLRSEK